MSFVNFYNDTAETWQEGLTIDRYPNNTGDYEPTNFRWATMKEQQQNRTNTKLTPEIVKDIRNSKRMAKDICIQYGVHEETIRKIRKNIRWQNV
jgi:pimeloyl-CoA synthetase